MSIAAKIKPWWNWTMHQGLAAFLYQKINPLPYFTGPQNFFLQKYVLPCKKELGKPFQLGHIPIIIIRKLRVCYILYQTLVCTFDHAAAKKKQFHRLVKAAAVARRMNVHLLPYPWYSRYEIYVRTTTCNVGSEIDSAKSEKKNLELLFWVYRVDHKYVCVLV